VTLDNNTISNNCETFNGTSGRTDFGSVGFSGDGSAVEAVPEPGTFALLGIASLGLLLFKFVKKETRIQVPAKSQTV
jgi:hypothetical protein